MMRKAMVVDDSKAIRIILTRNLNKLGYDVCTASNGAEALAFLNQQTPELSFFLVDWNMPQLTGIELVECVRRMPCYVNVPIMMVTTETEIEQMVRALEAGANEYLMKPFTEEMITDKLRSMGVLD
jgi:two-component system, chemotaxis family, chemotaxis protein CheY